MLHAEDCSCSGTWRIIRESPGGKGVKERLSFQQNSRTKKGTSKKPGEAKYNNLNVVALDSCRGKTQLLSG